MSQDFGSYVARQCAATGADVVAGNRACRTLMAICAGHTTYTEIMAVTGLSRSVTHRACAELRRLGLITWTVGSKGTIHPTSRLVA